MCELRRELGYRLAAPVVEGYVLVEELGALPMRLVGIDPFAEPPFRSYFDGDGSLESIASFMTRAGGDHPYPGRSLIATESLWDKM